MESILSVVSPSGNTIFTSIDSWAYALIIAVSVIVFFIIFKVSLPTIFIAVGAVTLISLATGQTKFLSGSNKSEFYAELAVVGFLILAYTLYKKYK